MLANVVSSACLCSAALILFNFFIRQEVGR